MSLLSSVWAKLRPALDLGVSPDMDPGDLKHVRLLNTLLGIALIIAYPSSLFGLLMNGELLNAAFLGVAGFLFLAGELFLSKTGRHASAMVLLLTFFYIYQTVMTVFFDEKTLVGYYSFIVPILLPFLLFPKGKNKTMYAMVAFGLICLAVTLVSKDWFKPLTPMDQTKVTGMNALLKTMFFAEVIFLVWLSRSFMIASEKRVKAEREKVERLSDKLKVYLPRQFVDALAAGGPEAQPEYRRRRLTVFFSDIKNFTPWTDKLEPEETRALLNQYLTEMSRIAHQFRGTIVQFVGDAIMIFFGDPEFTDDKDHALRCVRMAMAMQARMAELRAEWEDRGFQEPLHIRIGINTGYATVGAFGSEERLNYTALGSTVNMAARLEGVCVPDMITLSHMTWSLVKDEIECAPLGEVALKGFSEPAKIYEVVGGKGGQSQQSGIPSRDEGKMK